jgi:predicted Zn-dependent protease
VLLVTLGQVWLEVGEARRDRVALLKAVEALQRAIERGAPPGHAQSLLGRALLRLGDSRRALRALQAGTSTLPVPPEAFDWLGEAAEAQGRLVLAREALARAFALTGDAEDAARRARRAAQIGALSARLGASGDAQAWLQRAVALQPQDSSYRTRLAEVQRLLATTPP